MPATTPYTHPSRYDAHWRGVARRTGIDIHPGTGFDTILFVHGLGCSVAFFESADSARGLRGATLARLNLLGHGADEEALWRGGDPMRRYPDPMVAFADQLHRAWSELHATGRFHIVSHSMGTVPALILHSRLRRDNIPVTGRFISIEGNLTGEDCALASRTIATMTVEEDTDYFEDHREFTAFRRSLDTSSERADRLWGANLRWCHLPFLIRTAASLVDWCDTGRAADLWRTVDHPVYIYGSRTGYPEHHRDLLAAATTAAIPGSGHFPMIDNAPRLWETIADIIKEPHAY